LFLAVTQRLLGVSTGVLVAVPIPEEFSIDTDKLSEVIGQAVDRARCVQ